MSYNNNSIYSAYDGDKCKYFRMEASQYHTCAQMMQDKSMVPTMPAIRTQSSSSRERTPSLPNSKNSKNQKRMSNYASLTLSKTPYGQKSRNNQGYIRDSKENYDSIISPDVYDEDYCDNNPRYYEERPKPSNNDASGGIFDDLLKGISGIIGGGHPVTSPRSPNRAMSFDSDHGDRMKSPTSRVHDHFLSSPRSSSPRSPHHPPNSRQKRTPVCLGCKHPVHPADEDAFEIPPLNGFFHTACFTCIVCNSEFDDHNPFVPVPEEGVAYCELHFSQRFLENCAACLKPITDDKVSFAFGRAFHARHLRCHLCKERIKGPHVEHNGKAYCERDSHKISRSPSFPTSCAHCSQPITDDSISALGGIWHRQCFTCTLCSKPFPKKKFYIHEGRPYCLHDYYEATNAFCGACTQPIQGACIDVVEMRCRFHEDCWRCAGPCGEKLTGFYYSYRGAPYCEADIDLVYRKSDSSSRPEKRITAVFS